MAVRLRFLAGAAAVSRSVRARRSARSASRAASARAARVAGSISQRAGRFGPVLAGGPDGVELAGMQVACGFQPGGGLLRGGCCRVALACGTVPGGLGVRGAPLGCLQLAGQAGGLRLQLAGLLFGGQGAVFRSGPGVPGGVGSFPCRSRGFGGFRGAGLGDRRAGLGAAAGRLGLGGGRGDPLGSGVGNLPGCLRGQPARLGQQLAQAGQRRPGTVGRGRRHGRGAAAQRVVVPAPALVAAELPGPAGLLGRQRRGAARALAAPAGGRRHRRGLREEFRFASPHFVSLRLTDGHDGRLR